MGRPVKIAGNPAHPGSLGATSVHGQSVLLDFYDPDRSVGLLNAGDVATWQALLRAMLVQRAALAANQGVGFRILTGRVVSPTLGAAIAGLLTAYRAPSGCSGSRSIAMRSDAASNSPTAAGSTCCRMWTRRM